ncbi:hypothetical protein [Amycolatopsis sp. cmx-4-68]|uniref:hypothetical protein n=1 Tax=Amycolatopsis sp. cmx-4-68 TaxID=2790938 RepID=UPI00397BEC80
MTAPVFPLAPRDVTVEMYALGGWIDIFPDVQVAEKTDITITRGRPNESGDPPPQTCTLRLNNRSGKYSPKNPMSPYYGPTGLGRNTPIRVAVRTAKDAFARTLFNGWGTADVGSVWATTGFSDLLATDFNVAAGAGTMAMPPGGYRLAILGSQVYCDVEVAETVSVPFTAVTGDYIDVSTIGLSGLSTTDYFKVNTRVTTSQTVVMSISHFDGTTIVADTTVPGLTFTGQPLRVRAHVDAQNIRGKVWPASQPEPYAWNVDGRTDKLFRRAAGWVALRSGVGPANTNSARPTVSHSALEVRVPRFAGEVSKWPPRWDASGNNVWTTITASGIRRRLGQGQTPLKSTYLRGNQTITPGHVAYYPVEELSGATQIASGIGGTPMLISGPGSPQFAADSSFPGSAAIGKPNQSRWSGPTLSGVAATGQIQLMFLLSVPASGETDQATFSQLTMTGTAGFCDLFYQSASGGVKLNFYDQGRNLIHTSATFATGVLPGQPLLASVQLTQSGADVAYEFAWWVVGQPGAFVQGGTLTGRTIGAPIRVLISPYTQVASSAIGHVAMRNNITSVFTLGNQFVAYAGEASGARVGRLCAENGIPVQDTRNLQIGSAACGVQARATATDLIDEAVAADMGSLYESRSVLGLWRRGRSSLYNQPAVLALDYPTAGHVAPPFAPVEDDQFTRNDVTVTRKNGSSYEVIQTSGPLAVTAPSDGAGVGRYDDAVTLNLATDTQTPDAAAWLVHLGTVDETRYPQLTVDLAALARVDQARALAALAVNLDDRITVSNPKLEVSPDMLSLLARGYTEKIGQLTHKITFNCAPETPYQAVQFDAAGSKWDSSDSQLYAAAGAADTVLIVGSPSGERWTTSAGAMPIPLKVGGELVTATSIAPQGMSFVAAGAASEGSNAPRTPALPAGAQAGDLLLILAAIRNSPDGGMVVDQGYTLLGYANNLCLWGKIHSGSEVAPTVTFTNGIANATCHAQMAAFRGVSARILGAASQLNASAQNIAYPALPIPQAPACVLYLGWKQDDWTSVATIAGAAEIGEVSTTTGDDAGIVWDYVLQASTPVNVAAGSFVVTGGAAAISRGMVVALDGSCQAFTVTRSGNRVVKAQAAGTAIGLARRATLGL